MELPANLNVYAAAALFVIGAYLMAIYVGMVVWTFRDIHSRSRDILAQILSVLLVLLFNLPGILVYILVRPKETLSDAYERALAEEAVLQDLEDRQVCPSCQHRIREDYVVCPHCKHELRSRCANCGRLLVPSWELCPYCGHERQEPDEVEHVVDSEDVPAMGAQPALATAELPRSRR
jgi:predicted RNA-binding Zn-ribbon protein involved in translation (DUF1610 family)